MEKKISSFVYYYYLNSFSISFVPFLKNGTKESKFYKGVAIVYNNLEPSSLKKVRMLVNF